jgi:hypothetical protein
MGSGLVDWIYWHFFTVTTNYSTIANLPTSPITRTCAILVFVLSTVPAVKVKVTLRLTVSQSVSLRVEPHLGLMTRYLLLFDSYGLVSLGRPLWREDGFVFCTCCWPLRFEPPERLQTLWIIKLTADQNPTCPTPWSGLWRIAQGSKFEVRLVRPKIRYLGLICLRLTWS